MLTELEVDEATLVAALLHDTIEDGLLQREYGEITPVTRDISSSTSGWKSPRWWKG